MTALIGLVGWGSALQPAPAVASEAVAAGTKLEVGGYADIRFDFHDHGADGTQPGGADADFRAEMDLARFVIELEGEIAGAVAFEAEVEFEHGGTGASLELEYEEFGEYETEVGKGGEVLLETLFIEVEPFDWLKVRLGRFYVAVGLLPELHKPTDLLGASRPEAETRLLPGVWDELGLDARVDLPGARLTLQVVNGLDSSGFSAQQWVASGHQRRFEKTRASAVAFVGRVDLTGIEGVRAGASAYFGDTVGNRPKPDLDLFAPVIIASAHFAVDLRPVRARGSVVWGHLEHAEEISEKNRRLSNQLGVLRSPVASQAFGAWAEVGVDIPALFDLRGAHQLELFASAEYYDTMFRVTEDIFDNPRFERIVLAAGLDYTFDRALVLKLDVRHRRFGSAALRNETSLRLAAGFVF